MTRYSLLLDESTALVLPQSSVDATELYQLCVRAVLDYPSVV